MGINVIDLSIIIAYTFAILAYGLWSSRLVKTLDDYTVAGRKLGFVVLTGTLVMTELNPSTMTWFSSLSYSGGRRALLLSLIFITGLGSYAILVARRWQRLKAVSLAEMFEARYSRSLRYAISLTTTLILVLFSAGYLIAVTKTFSAALDLPDTGPILPGIITANRTLVYTAVVITFTVLIFTLAGGLISVAFTDTVSLFLTLVCVPLFSIKAMTSTSVQAVELNSYTETSSVLPIDFFLTQNVVIFLVYPLAPWYAQRMFAARDEKTAFRAVVAACLLTAALYASIQTTTHFYYAADPNLTDPDQALGRAIGFFMAPGLRGLMLAMIFGVCQTTMSSIWNSTASIVVQDFYKGWLKPDAGEPEQLRVGRWVTAIVALFTLLLCTTLLGRLLVVINLFGNTLFAAMFFPCVFGFLWWRANTKAAWACLLTGWVLGVGIAIYANFLADPQIPFPVWARWVYVFLMPGVCLLGIVVSLRTSSGKQEVLRRVNFFDRVGAPWIGRREFAAYQKLAYSSQN